MRSRAKFVFSNFRHSGRWNPRHIRGGQSLCRVVQVRLWYLIAERGWTVVLFRLPFLLIGCVVYQPFTTTGFRAVYRRPHFPVWKGKKKMQTQDWAKCSKQMELIWLRLPETNLAEFEQKDLIGSAAALRLTCTWESSQPRHFVGCAVESLLYNLCVARTNVFICSGLSQLVQFLSNHWTAATGWLQC